MDNLLDIIVDIKDIEQGYIDGYPWISHWISQWISKDIFMDICGYEEYQQDMSMDSGWISMDL